MNEDYPQEGLAGGIASTLAKKPAVIQALDEQERTQRQLLIALRALEDRLTPVLTLEAEKNGEAKDAADRSPMLSERVAENTRIGIQAVNKIQNLTRRLQI